MLTSFGVDAIDVDVGMDVIETAVPSDEGRIAHLRVSNACNGFFGRAALGDFLGDDEVVVAVIEIDDIEVGGAVERAEGDVGGTNDHALACFEE